MIKSIHLKSDSLIPKSQIDLIAGKLSMICLLTQFCLNSIRSRISVEDVNEK